MRTFTPITVGERIKHYREVLKITQEDMASIGISRNFISMIETGKRMPSEQTAQVMADYFNQKAKENDLDIIISGEIILEDERAQSLRFCREIIEDPNANLVQVDEGIRVAEAYRLSSEAGLLLLIRGEILMKNMEFIPAVDYLYESLERFIATNQPAYICKVYSLLGTCKYHLELLEDAEFYYLKSLKLIHSCEEDPRSTEVLLHLARVQGERGRLHQALDLLDEYTRKRILQGSTYGLLEANLLKAELLLDHGKKTEAYKVLKKIEESPIEAQHEAYGHLLAKCLLSLELYDEAADILFQLNTTCGSKCYQTEYLLAKSLLHQGRDIEASRHLDQSFSQAIQHHQIAFLEEIFDLILAHQQLQSTELVAKAMPAMTRIAQQEKSYAGPMLYRWLQVLARVSPEETISFLKAHK